MILIFVSLFTLLTIRLCLAGPKDNPIIDLLLLAAEKRMVAHCKKTELLLPYFTWSDTVAHTTVSPDNKNYE